MDKKKSKRKHSKQKDHKKSQVIKHSNKTTKKESKVSIVENEKKLNIEKSSKTVNLIKWFLSISGFIIICFLIFICWQVYFVHADHFVDYIPKKGTSFVMELDVNEDFQKHYKEKQMLFENIIGQNNLKSMTKENLYWVLNGEYRAGYAIVNGKSVLGISPINFTIQDLLNDLDLFIKKDSSGLILSFNEENEYYLKTIGDFLFISSSKKIIDNVEEEPKYDTLSYYSLSNFLSYVQYFKPVNIFYFSSDLIYKNLLIENIDFSKDIDFKELLSVDNQFFVVGSFDIDDSGLNMNMKRYELNPMSIHSPPTNFIEESYCSDDVSVSISGYDLSSKWKSIQTSLFNMKYSVLQVLTYDFINDIRNKTGFDLESELLFKIKDRYCLQIDDNSTDSYFFKFKPDSLFDWNKFYEKIKIVFFRYMSLAKPRLQNYELPDGTLAAEWIIDLNDNLLEGENIYNGVKIKTVGIADNDNKQMYIALKDSQVFISNDLDMMKKNIDKTTKEKEEMYISRTSIDFEKVLSDFDTVKRIFNKDVIYDLSEKIRDVKNVDFKETSYNNYEVLIEF